MFRFLFALAAAATLGLAPNAARAEWYEASSAHFVVYSDEQPEKLKSFATTLERYDKAFRLLRGFEDPDVGKANRLFVYVVRSTDAVAKLAGEKSIAGFYRPRAGGSIAIVPRQSGGNDELDLSPMQILLHEYAHHLMYSVRPNAAYPLWFSEGWAEFHATAAFGKDGSVTFGSPPQYRAYSLMSGNWLTIDKLLVADTLKLTDDQREGLYGRGWLLTHYLTNGGARPGQLNAYILAINQGKSPLEAAKVFGDLRALDKELEHYKGRNGFAGRRLSGDALTIGDITLRKLTAGEAATMSVRILSKNGVDEKTAPGVYDTAKKVCAPYPNDPGAQLVLAEAAFDAGDYTAAEAATDRAIAADPSAVRAYTYKAMARMEVAKKASDTSKETWRAIRKLISTANKLDPEDPEPLILFYDSFLESDQDVTKNAREGLYYAFVLAPQDPGLRMNVASAYMFDNQFATARKLLQPLAYDPHSGGLAQAAADLIKEIDRRAAAAPPSPKIKPAPANGT